MLLWRARMRDSIAPSGIDPPSPSLSARLRELADYLAAPAVGRLTEEQRALSLGIARRLTAELAPRLDPAIDIAALWHDWLRGGLPAAGRLAAPCFARAEEHRWRAQSALRESPPPVEGEGADAVPAGAPLSPIDRARLALRIADRRRSDALGNPCLASADLDPELFRALLLDIAAWRLGALAGDSEQAADLGEAVRALIAAQADERGIDAAARDYHDILADEGGVAETAAAAISGHDWPALIALAAAAHRRRYGDMALALLTAEAAALPSLLAPLRLDRAALAPLEASLARLSGRALAGCWLDDAAPEAEV